MAEVQEIQPLPPISLGVDGYCRVADIQQRLGARFPERIAPYTGKPASDAAEDQAEQARRQARYEGQMSQEKAQHLIRAVFALIQTALQEKSERVFPIPSREVPTLRAVGEISAEAVAHLVEQADLLTAFFAEPGQVELPEKGYSSAFKAFLAQPDQHLPKEGDVVIPELPEKHQPEEKARREEEQAAAFLAQQDAAKPAKKEEGAAEKEEAASKGTAKSK
jgi:hypothetical protein